jgi:hypothetical protein
MGTGDTPVITMTDDVGFKLLNDDHVFDFLYIWLPQKLANGGI